MRFTLALYARSGRWIPPALLLTTWVVLVVANPGSALDNASNLFFAVLVVAVWCTSTMGNVDDDPHRDLCAASVGGPARLTIVRHTAALALMMTVVLVIAALAIASGKHTGTSAMTVVSGALGVLVSGALLGVAIGSFLHRPVLRSVAWTAVGAIVAIVIIAILPPVRDVLRDAERAQIGGVGALLAVSVALVVLAAWTAGALAARTS